MSKLTKIKDHEVIVPKEYRTDKGGHSLENRERARRKEKKNRIPKPWKGTFQAFDGEGWDGKYVILACSAMPYDLCDEEGLSTGHCLSYLTDRKISSMDAIIGFGLSYDFEMILRDLPEEDFFKLKDMQKVEFYDKGEHYTLLNYIPRKQLEIHRHYVKRYKDEAGQWVKEDASKKIILQDVWGFFQGSFEAALEKWKIETPPIIKEGKALRNEFNKQPLQFIKDYNREELRLMIELMGKLRIADQEAFETIGLHANHKSRIWYGPGSRAQNLLTQTNWVEDHPPFSGPAADNLVKDVCHYFEDEELIMSAAWLPSDEGLTFDEADKKAEEKKANEKANLSLHPFSAAYFGGRIEAAAVGTFRCQLWDYDINSAYPYAIANLPYWTEEDLVEVQGWDELDRMGMYHIKWDLPQGVAFYPFPYRSISKNVFFPRYGEGWVMSPEVDAARELYSEGIEIINGYVLKGTEGAGDGMTKLADHKLCETAKKITEMAAARLEAKKAGESKEKSLKLILNSTYGKTIQHIGSHKFLNTFAAAWITSTCRAIISQTIGRDTENNIIAIMTDGILTRKKFDVNTSKMLGDFDEPDKFNFAIQMMPGVYLLEREDGTAIKRFRGMSKMFNPKDAVKILHKQLKPHEKPHSEKGGYYPITVVPFVSRTLAIRQPNVFGDKMYLFTEHTRMESFGLGAKRAPGKKGYRLKASEEFKFFEPKEISSHFMGAISTPYYLGIDAAQKEYEDTKDLEELIDDDHIGSILRNMSLDL